MANILDYLDWRGDLTLAQDPFNEVDNLILAELSFVDFGGIVPGPGGGRAVPLWKAAEAYFAKTEGRPIDMGVLVPNQIPELLRRALHPFYEEGSKGYTFACEVPMPLPMAYTRRGAGSLEVLFAGKCPGNTGEI